MSSPSVHPARRSLAGRWLYALKPASWPKLLVPALLGTALGAAHTGRLDFGAFAWTVAFTVADLAFIVFMNDYGDRYVDGIKRSMFPVGCSPKTIPDGILPAWQVLFAGAGAGAIAIAIALMAGGALGRWWLGGLGLLAVGTFVAYTLPPLKLNYRGGGELLEMLGVGLLLPLFGAYAQTGELWFSKLGALAGFLPLALASAVASGLSDERSDRAGGKRTVTTMLGNRLARRLVEASVMTGIVIWAATAIAWPAAVSRIAGACAVAITMFYYIQMRRVSGTANTNAFPAIASYKNKLHGAIWIGALVLGFAEVFG